MKVFATLDLSTAYIRYGVNYYLANHPTEADNFNAGLKSLETLLRNAEFPDVSGQQLLALDPHNLTHLGGGVFRVEIDLLKNPVQIGNALLKEEAGAILKSTDAGLTWTELGAGGGGVSDHVLLSNIGVNTHAQLDTHLADTSTHFTQAQIDHANLSNRGSYTHAQLDSHIDNHPGGVSDHTLLSNIGTTSHADIDAHIADTGIHGGGGGGSVSILSPGPITSIPAHTPIFKGVACIGLLDYNSAFCVRVGDASDMSVRDVAALVDLTISFFDGGAGDIQCAFWVSGDSSYEDLSPQITCNGTNTWIEATIRFTHTFSSQFGDGYQADLKIFTTASEIYLNALTIKRLDTDAVFAWRA